MASSEAAKVVDDDLDDLDDVLDEFQTNAPVPRAASPSPALDRPVLGPPRPPEALEGAEDDGIDEQFLLDMQKSMEEMLKGMSVDPSAAQPAAAGTEGANGMPDLDSLFKQFLEAEMPGLEGEPKGKERAAPDTDFQEGIRRTLDKMRESGEGVKAGLEKDDDPMAAMLKMLSGGGADSEEGLREALEGMMEQLLSKDLLEEPLQALADKYPAWIAKNRSTLPATELSRYERQIAAITALLAIFHDPKYSADDSDTNKKVMDLMTVIQDCGAPPQEVFGELPEGVNIDPQTGLPAMPEACTIS